MTEMEIDSPASSIPKISLKIHETITTLQNENGLRHQDFMRYRYYLTRKLKIIRKSVGFTFGKGKVYTKREITPEMVTSPTYLLIPLLTAERAWSHASELKDAFTKVGKNKIRNSEVEKFSKAAKWASHLDSLCSEVGDVQTALEASAYSSWMGGQSFLEKEMWSEAVAAFSKAKSIYEELSKLGSLDQQDLFTKRVTDMEPSLRFCRYNVSGSGNVQSGDITAFSANPELQEKLEEMRLKQPEGATQDESRKLGFTWAARPVLISSEKLQIACTKIKHTLDAMTAKSLSITPSNLTELPADGLGKQRNQEYMRVTAAIDDAREIVSDELSKLALGGEGRLGEAKSELTHIKCFLQCKKQEMLLRRTEELITIIEGSRVSSEKRVFDLAHLYDQQLKTVREMLSVPGSEEDDLLTLRLSAHEQLLRCTRALYMAECYLVETKWGEGSALIDLADSLVSTVYDRVDDLSEALHSSDDTSPQIQEEKTQLAALQSSLTHLEKQVAGTRCRIPALALLHASQQNELPSTIGGAETVVCSGSPSDRLAGSLLSRKDEWTHLTPRVEEVARNNLKRSVKTKKTDKVNFGEISVYDIPPAFAPIPCKPVFFDIAFNYIEAPDIDGRAGLASKREENAPAGLVGAAQSLFGWFRK
mmetsp:Transcript_20440/g.20558  ORF Transcript_20440/g.20558 Transcript_20440/m.20558 type:complete len:648 (-) Transcript_20440:69-2012(-)|eukprot:CAMPEP_0182430584 /NCGR_PEP_ID=MMETSP1167-20130531/41847_1 /TAXON_ID=2988 /ORGANISM="Mallomonas Sp, Strain CCMP3275" /LENGTH=647 /DNA_ID=CAMNT_0024615861 /DNA_START=35 /DNA_END=1978 /DNA_ORIENTATION=-